MNIILTIIISAIVFIGAGAIGALVYYKTRPKKIIYGAKCYQITDSKIDRIIDKKTGKVLRDFELTDLQPYCEDVLEVAEKEGITLSKLQTLNLTTGEVEAKHIENWKNKKVVSVLIHKGSATLLEKGYDLQTAKVIFKPLGRERIDMVTQNIMAKKDRLQIKEKDILSSITPWVITAVCMIGLIIIANVMGNAHIKAAEIQEKTSDQQIEAIKEFQDVMLKQTQINREMYGDFKAQNDKINKEKSLGIQK